MSKACAKCGGRMEQGFTLDHTDGGGRSVTSWVEGAPQKGWFGWISLRGKRKFEVQAWRCPRCFLLENYAPE